MQDLGGHPDIFRNDFGHALQRRIFVGQLFGQQFVQGGEAGQGFDARSDLLELVAGEEIAQGERAGDGGAQFVGVARFGEVLVGRPNQPENGFPIRLA